MTTRLNNHMRQDIAQKLVQHRFDAEIESLRNEQVELAERVYADIYAGDDMKRIESLPKNWLPTRREMQLEVGGETVSLQFNGDLHSRDYRARPFFASDRKGMEKPFPRCDHWGTIKQYGSRSPIGKAINDFTGKVAKLVEQISEAHTKVSATLGEFYTVKSLVDGWPEIKPFIPEKEQKVLLPAVPTKQLNEMFGLPV